MVVIIRLILDKYNYDKKFFNITINWINKFNKFKLPNPRIYNDFIKRKYL